MNQRIETTAQQLLDEHGLSELPVPVEMIAEQSGAAVRYRTFDGDVSGLLLRTEDGIIIGVNSTHPKTRQRFTIAHELGHLLLHKEELLHVDESASIRFRDEESSLATKADEIEANQFASELLMPAHLVWKEIDALPDDLDPEDAIPVLAERFEVSEQAMTLRLNRLGALV